MIVESDKRVGNLLITMIKLLSLIALLCISPYLGFLITTHFLALM